MLWSNKAAQGEFCLLTRFHSFAVHGPVVWNSLLHDLRSTDLSVATFRNRLKTFLFDADT